MTIWGSFKYIFVGASLALTACDLVPSTSPTSPLPKPRPAGLSAPASATPERSVASRNLSVYYQRLENNLLTQGLLRRDGGGIDVPFNARNLAENFTQIALFNEYRREAGTFVSTPTASDLRRWDSPIRMSVEFGATVPEAQRSTDTASVRKYAARLSRLTDVPITVTDRNPNFIVMIVNEDDRAGFVPRVQEFVPGISDSSLRAFSDIPRSTLCLALAFSENGASSSYSKVVAVIRGEHPDLLRLSCIHEELAQGMGLANDSPAARPSIFNDDEEFGLLTTHDEQLLQMLYDPRLRTGMTATEARPIINTIAEELIGGTKNEPNS